MANVGFSPDRKSRKLLTSLDYATAGAFSAFATRATCQPLDVLKIRLQLQVECKATAKYKSMFHAVPIMLKEEGPRVFWKGHMPAQYLSIFYGMFQFSAFEAVTKSLFELASWTTDENAKPFVHMVVGGMAGVFGTIASYPFDVVRTRLVAQGNERAYSGTIDAFKQMWTAEGIKPFYRGCLASLATVAPYSGLQFGFYTFFAQILAPFVSKFNEELGETKMSMSGSLSCGALAGLCAKASVFPFDTTKKRLQVMGFDQGRKGMGRNGRYTGILNCMTTIIKTEGIRSLFKGLTPGLVKAVATTSVNFWFYEHTLYLLILRRQMMEKK